MSRNPDDPRPEYVQIADDLRAAITSGRLKPGEKLPSRAKLAEEYGVATGTLNQAIQQLIRDGVLSAWQRGTFVRQAPAQEATASPEYTAIMSEIRVLRDDLVRMGDRLSRLEGLVDGPAEDSPA
ncbi:GntR family transcriptional regulator [Sphaerisporangium rhizosphaerae]|uniref:GntR family transcriptional regulator n=1 Tax=Sphaerisporangium rhizosphaerae TaxID=2269375 RepID=A0ABW2NXR3_9ACTN